MINYTLLYEGHIQTVQYLEERLCIVEAQLNTLQTQRGEIGITKLLIYNNKHLKLRG